MRLEDLSTLCSGAEGRTCPTFLCAGWALSLTARGTRLSAGTAGCCTWGRTASLLITGAGDVLVLSLRSANGLLPVLLFALPVAGDRRPEGTRLLPDDEGACWKFLEGLVVLGLLTFPFSRLPEVRPEGLRGETVPWLLLLSEGRAWFVLLFPTRPEVLSEGRALPTLLTGAGCVLLLYDTGRRLSLVTTSLRLL